MGIGGLIKKVGTAVKKQTQKAKINSMRRRELQMIKEKYLGQLSHSELVQMYKTYIRE